MAERKLLSFIPLTNTHVITRAEVRFSEKERKDKAAERGVKVDSIPDGEEAEMNQCRFMKVWDDGAIDFVGFDKDGKECDPTEASDCVGFIFEGKHCVIKAKKVV